MSETPDFGTPDYEAAALAEEIGRFDDVYTPAQPRRPGLDSLPDGDYELEIGSAEFTRTDKTREAILRMMLRVCAGPHLGQVVEHVYFFQTAESVGRIGADLISLGLPADRWTAQHGVKFSEQLIAHLHALRGMRFRGKKTSYEKVKGGTGHGLWISARLPAKGTPITPPPARPLPAPAPAASQAGNGVPGAIPPPEDDIPFSFWPFLPLAWGLSALAGGLFT